MVNQLTLNYSYMCMQAGFLAMGGGGKGLGNVDTCMLGVRGDLV